MTTHGKPAGPPRPGSGSLVLLIEDDDTIRFAMDRFFSTRGFQIAQAGTCEEGERRFLANPPDVVLLDNHLPDGDGVDLLGRLRAIDPSTPVILLTGNGSIDIAVRAIKDGAEQFFVKPVDLPTLFTAVQRVVDHRRGQQARLAGRAREARNAAYPFIGKSPAIQRLQESATRVLSSASPVLILGETGSGKGVLAKWIHQNSARADETFVDLNCAGLSREFLETELFGHEKGAFTGAAAAKQGLFEVAHRGTLFLDEIGDVDPAVQPKLLKVLEEQQFRRMGDVRDRRVDVRLIAATHADLARDARFRKDLYYRVSALPLRVPPLKERGEDVVLIAETLLARIGADLGRNGLVLDDDASLRLLAYPWPGNIREMRNVIERAVLLLGPQQAVLSSRHIDEVLGNASEDAPATRLTLLEVERRHIERVLREEGGDVAAAAAILGLARSSLYDRLKKHGLSPASFTAR